MENPGDSQDSAPANDILICPFCQGEFSHIPEEVKVFDCGWCSNRLVMKNDIPALYWKNFFSRDTLMITHLLLTSPEALVVRNVISYGESWKENRQNLYVAAEMCVLFFIYLAVGLYLRETYSHLAIFNQLIFYAVPAAIGFYYYFVYVMRMADLHPDEIPVIRPELKG